MPYKTREGKSRVRVCRYPSPDKLFISPATSKVIYFKGGNALTGCLRPMSLETKMAMSLLQELLMALRANDAEGYIGWQV